MPPLMFPILTKFMFYHAAAYSDVSVDMNDFQRNAVAFPYTTAADYLYIGRDKPFSDLWVELQTPNVVAASMVMEYWNGTTWKAFSLDVDDTKGFTRSGWIRWNKNAMTASGSENAGNTDWTPNAVNSVTKDWIRLSFDQTLTAGTMIMAIGIVFSDDLALARAVPDVRSFLPAASDIAAAWTSFILSHVEARDIIAQRLRSAGKLKIDLGDGFPYDLDEWDLHRIDQVKQASKWLTLGIIFQNLSQSQDDGYSKRAVRYMELYEDSFKTALLSLDFDNNGQENPAERSNQNNSGRLSRF